MAGQDDVDCSTGEELEQPVETGDHEVGLAGRVPVYQPALRGVQSVARHQDSVLLVHQSEGAGRVTSERRIKGPVMAQVRPHLAGGEHGRFGLPG